MTVVLEPSTRGVLTRFRKRPRAGGGRCVSSGPRGRFQPTPATLLEPSPPGFRPDVSGSPSGSVAKAARRPRPALPARSPPPRIRSPAERPPPRRGKEKYGRGFRGDASILDVLVGGGVKALILLGFDAPIPVRRRGQVGFRRLANVSCSPSGGAVAERLRGHLGTGRAAPSGPTGHLPHRGRIWAAFAFAFPASKTPTFRRALITGACDSDICRTYITYVVRFDPEIWDFCDVES